MTSRELNIFQAINLDGMDTSFWGVLPTGCGEISEFFSTDVRGRIDFPIAYVWTELETFSENYPNLSKIKPDEIFGVTGHPEEKILIYYLESTVAN